MHKHSIAHYWNKPLSELVDIGPYNATPAEMERHRVYANLVLALLHGYFNGNKDGETGEYPWQPSQRIAGTGTQSLYAGGRYLGHNICCIAVDGDGDIIDFDFNHNSIFNSSVEHAEARALAQGGEDVLEQPARVGLALHQAPSGALVDQVAHGLFAHACSPCQIGQA